MKLLTCILTGNDCFKAGRTVVPKGVMVHSTGANNPNLRRYVQPDPADGQYAELMAALGENRYRNDWNRPGTGKCTHGFIGKLADGSVAAVQTLPWEHRGWHAGTGSRGSANDTHVSFEICEDDLTDGDYFAAVWKEAVELTAMLCGLYGIDPLADGAVISHNEGHDRYGVASNHGDPDHWFARFGKTMDDFRAEAAALLAAPEEDVIYRVQVGAFRNRAYAEALKEELEGLGYSVWLIKA